MVLWYNEHMLQKFKNRKVHLTMIFGAVVAGIILFQGVVPKESREPKIDSISPTQGPAGTQITIIGSGFTTQQEGASKTRIGKNILPPANYLKIKGQIVGVGAFSPEGRTLTFTLDISGVHVQGECAKKLAKKENCKIAFKIVNAYGKESNEAHFILTPLSLVPVAQLSCDTSAPRPAGFITYDTCYDVSQNIIRRANGDLVVATYSSDTVAATRIYVSKDNGATWSGHSYIFGITGWGLVGLTENADGQLVLASNSCQNSQCFQDDIGIYIWTSNDGINWVNKSKIPGTTLDTWLGSIIQGKDGYYYFTYYSYVPAALGTEVYVTRSKNLVAWEAPALISNTGTGYASPIVKQMSDGMFYLIYQSRDDDGAVVMFSSSDGQVWNKVGKVAGMSNLGIGHLNMIEVNSVPVVFGTPYPYGLDWVYTAFVNGSWSPVTIVLPNTPNGGIPVLLADGSIGVAYTYMEGYPTNASGQLDIRFTNIGKLSF